MDPNERRIVVEVLTPESVSRLEARDEELREEIHRLEGVIEGLHRTLYEVIEAISKLRKK